MLIIPAIDLQNGRCVRLRQGDMQDATIFSEDPAAVARQWVEAGAERVHVVDLDGAKAGKPVNTDAIAAIVEACDGVPVQLGGGIRDEDAVQKCLEAGVQWVIIGTRAVSAPHFVGDLCVEFPSHIIVGLDARDGKVAIDGWSKLSNHDVLDMARHFEEDGVEAIIFTDISRDGMMEGVNVEATRELAAAINIPVIASGGVTSMQDIAALKAVEEDGIMGAVVGRALYEGSLDLAEAIRAARSQA